MRTLIAAYLVAGTLRVMACAASDARPVAYGAELQACTETSKTLAESIACENGVRLRYGRSLRDAGAE